MIRSRSLIGLPELCTLDENSEEVHNLQPHDGLLDENAEEVHTLHHNCNLMMVSLMRMLKRSLTCTITCNLLMVSLMRTLKRPITCHLLMKKCVPDGHQNSVFLMRTNLQSPDEKQWERKY